MISAEKIATRFYGLVGLRQPFNPAYAKLDADNLISRSGLFVTDNEFCKVEYLYDSQDFVDISDSDFNLWLKRKQQESAVSICNSVFNMSSFRERNLMYKNAPNKAETVTLPVGFVGYRLRLTCENNVGVSIKRVVCDFAGTGAVDLMLFSASSKLPLFTQTIDITSDTNAFDLDWTLDKTSDYGKEYYVGYIANGLTVSPYERNYNLSNQITSFRDFSVETIYANSTASELFDLRIVEGFESATGLNFDITTYDDYTDLAINNEALFARAILLDFQISCLSTYMASLRSNSNERNGERQALRILAEVEGQNNENAIKITGLRPQLFRAISTLRTEVKALQEGYFGGQIMVDTIC